MSPARATKGCAVKDGLLHDLMRLASEHFEITRQIETEWHHVPTDMSHKCRKLRSEWERLREEMERHCKEHGC
jgi:hypothetical protein